MSLHRNISIFQNAKGKFNVCVRVENTFNLSEYSNEGWEVIHYNLSADMADVEAAKLSRALEYVAKTANEWHRIF